MKTLIKYSSTNRFADIVESMRAMKIPVMRFRSKIKLHGANVAIVQNGGDIYLQGRREVVGAGENDDLFNVSNELRLPTNLYREAYAIFGEWAGQGCAKNPDIVSSIPKKHFFPFAIVTRMTIDEGEFIAGHIGEPNADVFMSAEPHYIQHMLDMAYGRGNIPDNIKIIPYEGDEIEIRAYDAEHNKAVFEKINARVEEIGKEDPLIKEWFGLSGKGEGLVFTQVYPEVPEGFLPKFFKVKSEAHDVIKRSHSRHEIVIPEDVKSFVDAFVTENRVVQMAEENTGGVIDMKVMNKLIPAVMRDIIKEGKNEIEKGGLDVKTIGKVAPENIRRIVFQMSNRLAA